MRPLLLVPLVALWSCAPEKECVGTCPVLDAGALDAGAEDAGLPVELDAGCLTCTDLALTLGTARGTFDRAQHGLEPDGGLYVEAHFGGDPACPTAQSPTPDRTLIIAGLRVKPDGGAFTYAEGLRVSLLDFRGTLTMAPLLRATAATARALSVEPGVRVVYDVDAAFPDGGALSGRFSALHCTSLDGP